MIENFKPTADTLRKIGNNRMPYAIFVDIDSAMSQQDIIHKASLSFAVDKQICVPEDGYNLPVFVGVRTIRRYATIDELVEQLLSCNNTTCIVFGHRYVLTEPIILMFNEVHSLAIQGSAGAFKCICDEPGYRAYIRKLIDNPDIVAFNPKNALHVLSAYTEYVKWEPWLTLLLNKQTGYAAQIVWDTRAILGIAKLSIDDIQSVLQCQNANDNSLMLYNATTKPLPENCGFEEFVVDEVVPE